MSGLTFVGLCACAIGVALLVVTFAFQPPGPRFVQRVAPACAPAWTDLGITPDAGGGAGMGRSVDGP